MIRFSSKARTALALGLTNIAKVTAYRFKIRQRWSAVRRLTAQAPHGPFFAKPTAIKPTLRPASEWITSARIFSFWSIPVSSEPPDWRANPLTGHRMGNTSRGWWEISDFDPAVGDIKQIWELSRMDWVLALAQGARNGDAESLMRLNRWLSDWCANNPPYLGPNWKCGQEASIRVMHLAIASLILQQQDCPTTGLRDLVQLHMRRIVPTLHYAMAQDNNHGTSEAAALFIGGSWLATQGIAEAVSWKRQGVKWLENRAAKLIGHQGSFSQYSLNYHRMMLDTFSMVELWRRELALPEFSDTLRARATSAAFWLYNMVNPISGDGPNVGANDGTRLLQLTSAPYRDYRPTVQLAMTLFANLRAYSDDGPWNDAMSWLGLSTPKADATALGNFLADDGGFAVLRRGAAVVIIRYPRFCFRPSHADALHVDLWVGGNNLLRDGGTFSYNTEAKWLNYFAGTASHNTVQFDDRDQMPRLSRFLFGDWLKTGHFETITESEEFVKFGAGYQDCCNAKHKRRVSLGQSFMKVDDEVAGFAHKAVLRWRVPPGGWRLDGTSIVNGHHLLMVKASMPIVRFELVEGWESRHYLERTPVAVLEIEVQEGGTLSTEYRWNV